MPQLSNGYDRERAGLCGRTVRKESLIASYPLFKNQLRNGEESD